LRNFENGAFLEITLEKMKSTNQGAERNRVDVSVVRETEYIILCSSSLIRNNIKPLTAVLQLKEIQKNIALTIFRNSLLCTKIKAIIPLTCFAS